MISRRQFVEYLGIAGVSAVVSEAVYANVAHADTAPSGTPYAYVPTGMPVSGNVVVIGGGMGGATAAKYLRMYGGDKVNVTLVDKNATYTSNIKSNDVLTGQLTLGALQTGYTGLTGNYGVKFVQATATKIDTVGRKVTLTTGQVLAYDRLVLAPGVVFDALPGMASAALYDTTIPHAWQAGPQTTLLRQQLVAMPAGGTYVETVPVGPYRCCPGPYERACLVADWLRVNKPGSKVMLLDANADIQSEKAAFSYAFTNIHQGNLTYVPNAPVTNVDVAGKKVTAGGVTYSYAVFNPIPVHRAGVIAQSIPGLVDTPGYDSPTLRWCSVDLVTYESTKMPRVHVVGDAAYTVPQPKSGHMANAEAKVAAAAVVALLGAKAPDPAPVTSSACYSPLTMSIASWLTGVYKYDPATKSVAVKSGMATRYDASAYAEAGKWWSGLMADTFK